MRSIRFQGRQVLLSFARVAAGVLVAGAIGAGSGQAQTPGGAAQPPARTGGGIPNAVPQLDKLTLPPGFSAAVYASGVQGARSMAMAPDGTLFIGTRANKVYAVVDKDRDNVAETVIELSTGLRTPNGLAFRDGALYVGELNRIVRFDNVLGAVKAGSSFAMPTVDA